VLAASESSYSRVIRRLREGLLLYVGFKDTAEYEGVALREPQPKTLSERGIVIPDKAGNEVRLFGTFAALSYDEGKTWPTERLITDGGAAREFDGGAWMKRFVMDATHAEPRLGYLAATQTPDQMIHLISSRLHYRFNLAWLEQPMSARACVINSESKGTNR
jgi:hypothetical protein